MPKIIAFINSYLCLHGKLVESSFVIDGLTGRILSEPHAQADEVIDLKGKVIGPAYIELQTNGCVGVHFTQYDDPLVYQSNLKKVSKYMVSRGVGAFWATVPTVSSDVFQKVSIRFFSFALTPHIGISFWYRDSQESEASSQWIAPLNGSAMKRVSKMIQSTKFSRDHSDLHFARFVHRCLFTIRICA